MQAAPKEMSIFDKISRQIREFTQNLEKQAQEQARRQTDKNQENLWDSIVEDVDGENIDAVQPEQPRMPQAMKTEENEDDSSAEFETIAFSDNLETEKPGQNAEKIQLLKQGFSIDKPSVPGHMHKNSYQFRSSALQNAVVWSEILSSPLALRDKRR